VAQDNIMLAVSEAVTNAVRHAYEPGEGGMVEMSLSLHDGLIQVLVSDCGHGFRPHDSSGLGLGLPLMADMSTHLEINQGRAGTEVLMRFIPI
jgi:anti-sigma regulatory factor (Ser/Thr protein kinase)